MKNYFIRKERLSDYRFIYQLHSSIFQRENEALLVERLRKHQDFNPCFSLSAEYMGDLLGHALFFPVSIDTPNGVIKSLTLAPLAVEPAFQKTGVGQRLVEAGIKKAREALFQVIVAFGNPEFYARLKFRHAPSLSTNLPESIHHNQFMTYDLIHESNPPVEGCITFPKEYFLLDYPEENRTKSR